MINRKPRERACSVREAWHAALKQGAAMELDGTHALSGSNALHVHIRSPVVRAGRGAIAADATLRERERGLVVEAEGGRIVLW